jgi:hypothetical protein
MIYRRWADHVAGRRIAARSVLDGSLLETT